MPGSSQRSVLLGFVILTLLALPGRTTAETSARNVVGMSTTFLARPFAAPDPYSWSFGAGVFYERRLSVGSLPCVLSSRLTYLGSIEKEDLYGRSRMVLLGETLGVRLHPGGADSGLSFTPGLGLYQYWRRFDHAESTYRASRPVGGVLAALDLEATRSLVFGVIGEAFLILEQKPVFALGQSLLLGVRF